MQREYVVHATPYFGKSHLTEQHEEKKEKRDSLVNIKSLQSARVLRIRATIRLWKKRPS